MTAKTKLINSVLLICTILTSCSSSPIKGTWQYDGGIYDGKSKKAAPDLVMQRTYSNSDYEAFVVQPGAEKMKYGAGTYDIKADSLSVTSTFSSQPSQLLNKTVTYRFDIQSNRLTIKGILPNGMVVEEYWKKVD